MGLRERGQALAARLVGVNGDVIQIITVTTVDGATEFDPPVRTTVLTDIDALVSGSGKWADGVTILSTDLQVFVSGAAAVADVGDSFLINDAPHKIIQKTNIMATGTISAVRYFARRG